MSQPRDERTGHDHRVKPAADEQVQQMVADPARYFAEARAAARREARRYLAARGPAQGRRAHRAKPA